jgi:SprT protein
LKFTEIERCRIIAQDRFGVMPDVTIDWGIRGLTAGHCKYKAGGASEISLNADIALAEGEKFAATIAHEYAHAVDWALDFREGHRRKQEHHGYRWRRIMVAFGHPATRCHSYESAAPVRMVEKFRYRCACGPVQLVGPKVHRKLQLGATYICRKCKRRLIAEATMTAEQLLAKIMGDGE